jgi:multiple antibiotic resistance protein
MAKEEVCGHERITLAIWIRAQRWVSRRGLVVPIFVAMDPIGALPLVLAWTASLDRAERDRQLRDALVTAFTLGLVFILGGRWLLGILGVSVPDFLIAGGLVLLALAITDLVVGGSHEGRGSTGRPDFGAVPIGTPILVGPATLATVLVLVDEYGWAVTGLAFLLNLGSLGLPTTF